ncbi:bifunctional molybdopterin-guanine dinucleotide biosynthesis protein MobB/MoaE [Halorubrum californiense DSM 19288]|uniref:Bifunctional molybdopterin-guanine dinucleotide biosynthesis protein MobB/MoaE n=1 Tax=Halorubrum californiense DSM 19288 TaxID=1227465 RepID=M0EG21_9EURY|nr:MULTISPECIES: molybdopterin synthase [Halorubrum]ELZ46710.1 bifunctional molybdopterin-guanine dinucleotide biosynthesis protein MobB/MoaE [Halorubrum californiense DSM 19288]TKX67855.1 molybdopterin synthase [Halorubrum sp. GN11GM_10-3_MGM]
MRPISIVGDGAPTLARRLADRLDGRVAVVERGDDSTGGERSGPDRSDRAADGGAVEGEVADPAQRPAIDTEISFDADGNWSGRGTIDGFDDLLDGLAPDHDYLLAVDESRLRVPAVLLGPDPGPEGVPGTVLATAERPDGLDLDALVDDLDDAEPWITRETLVRRVEASADAERSGAIATFTGRVRAREAPGDDRTTHLAFEKYEGVAEARMDDIADELAERDGVFDVRMYHRTGVIEAGEDIVFVVVLAGHRREAFRTVEDGIDRLKDEVPIFKKEATESETFWVHRRD